MTPALANAQKVLAVRSNLAFAAFGLLTHYYICLYYYRDNC